MPAQVLCQQPVSLISDEGQCSTDAARYRIIYCARPAIENYFDDSVQPEGDSIH